jgi:hypothetical protein
MRQGYLILSESQKQNENESESIILVFVLHHFRFVSHSILSISSHFQKNALREYKAKVKISPLAQNTEFKDIIISISVK